MTLPAAFRPDAVAVITGGASGIGLAAARRFVEIGMRVALADLPGERLDAALAALQPLGRVAAFAVDVSDAAVVRELEARVRAEIVPASVVMANAGVQPGSAMFGPDENWRRTIDVNLWGVIHVARAFAPNMLAGGEAGEIIVTGS